MHLTLEDMVTHLMRRLDDVERRLNNSVRHGKVTDVDAKKRICRLAIGGTDDEPFKSPWMPYGQIAGALKIHSPPSVGQNMTAFSPSGDFRQATAMPFTWNDDNPSPSDKPDEHVLTIGNVKITVKNDLVEVDVGNAKFTEKNGSIELTVGGSTIAIDAGSIETIATAVATVGKTWLGQENRGERIGPLVETVGGPAKFTFAKT